MDLATLAKVLGAFCAVSLLPLLLRLIRGKYNFRGKHVLITGGSQGLGRAAAVQLAKRGAHVTIVARSEGKLKEAKAAIVTAAASKEQKVAYFTADVTDPASIQAAVDAAIAEVGPIDVLIANAGAACPGYFTEMPIEVFRKQMELNYLGTIHAVRAALPGMCARKSGRVVLVSSAAAFGGFVGYSAYSPTKAAQRVLGDCLRNEMRPFNIQVQMFFPSTMNTPGLATEEKTKPIETKVIEESDTAISEDQSARDLLQGIELGKYQTTQEALTELGRVLTNGLGERNNIFVEATVLPLLVFVQRGYMFFCDYVVGKHAAKRLNGKHQ